MPGQTQYGQSDYGLRPDGTMGFIKRKKPKPKPTNQPQAKIKGQRKGYNV